MKRVAEFCKEDWALCALPAQMASCVEEMMFYSLNILVVETSKHLQGEMCPLSINKMTWPIMKNVSVPGLAFNIPVSCVYLEL